MIIDVLGLGESLSLFRPNKDNITFGVNDIFRYYPVDYLVCIDKPNRFNDERLKIIKQSAPIKFFSHLNEWDRQPNFELIKLQQQFPTRVCDLDLEKIPKSVFSPYVAIALAYKLFKPSLINIYGVDMVSHDNLSKYRDRIRTHFKYLKMALAKKGCQANVYGHGILV